MALPGDKNPFIKILSEKPPSTGEQKDKVKFVKIPLATGAIAHTENSSLHSSHINTENIINDLSISTMDLKPVVNITLLQPEEQLAEDHSNMDAPKKQRYKAIEAERDTNGTHTQHNINTDARSELTTGHKQDTKGTQNSVPKQINKAIEAERDTNGTHTQHNINTDARSELTTGHKQDTKGTQNSVPKQINKAIEAERDTNGTHTQHNQDTIRDTERDTKNQVNPKKEELIRSLKGQQKNVFCYTCDELIKRDHDLLITTYDELAFYSKVPRTSIETTVKRLCNNKYLMTKIADKGGVGAQIKLSISDEALFIYTKNRNFLFFQRDTERDTERDTNRSRKEGSIFNNNFLTKSPNIPAVDSNTPEMFDTKLINYEYTRTHMPDFNYWPKYLNDLKRNLQSLQRVLTTVDLQNLIDRLPEYISFSSGTGQPLKHVGAFFIKEAMNFALGSECTLTLFKTQAEIKRQEALDKFRLKSIEEKKQIEADLDLIKNGVLLEWIESMSEEEQKRIAHPLNQSPMLIRSALRAKFETDVWAQKKGELGLD